MSFPRYSEYKDSGVEWLGEVPGHWVVAPLKRGFDVRLGKMLQPDAASQEDELLPYLRAANIQWSGIDGTDIKQMWFSQKERIQLALLPGDLLISEGGDVGRSTLWGGEITDCYFQNSVNRVRAREGNSNRYLYYWILAIKEKGYIDVLCNKSTIAHFTAEKVQAVPMPFPSIPEQQTIAAFLDRETAKIDALMAEQLRLIELLKEKRQAVISHAVTKGLNPDAAMKDSGIEWLGEVPEHWDIARIKTYLKTCSGGTPNTSQQELYYASEEDGIPWVRTTDLNNDILENVEVFITKKALADTACSILPCGTVMVAMYGGDGTVGKNGLLAIPAAINQAVCGLLPSESHNPKYLFRFMQFYRPYWMIGAESSRKDPNISQERVGNSPLLRPPLDEQTAIANFIGQETTKLDTLTSEAQTAITLLQERRTALISAAVTGKIDVRELSLSS